jgi:hypothetical protein
MRFQMLTIMKTLPYLIQHTIEYRSVMSSQEKSLQQNTEDTCKAAGWIHCLSQSGV